MRKFPSSGSMSKSYGDKQSAWKGRAVILTAIAAVVCLYFWFAGFGGGGFGFGAASFSGVDRSESYKVKIIPTSLSDEQLVLQRFRECTLAMPTWFDSYSSEQGQE